MQHICGMISSEGERFATWSIIAATLSTVPNKLCASCGLLKHWRASTASCLLRSEPHMFLVTLRTFRRPTLNMVRGKGLKQGLSRATQLMLGVILLQTIRSRSLLVRGSRANWVLVIIRARLIHLSDSRTWRLQSTARWQLIEWTITKKISKSTPEFMNTYISSEEDIAKQLLDGSSLLLTLSNLENDMFVAVELSLNSMFRSSAHFYL